MADYDRLQAAAVAGVIGGVVLLAAAAFLLSYGDIHGIAVAAGVAPAFAGLYPLIFDAALVLACASVLALRGAAWRTRAYPAICYLLLIVAAAVIGALRAAGVNLPERAAAATLAALPWVLFLLGFGLGLSLLKHRRTVREMGPPQGPRNPPRPRSGTDARPPMASSRSREPLADPRRRERSVNPRSSGPAVNPRPREPVMRQRAADPGPPLDADRDEPYVRLIPASPKPATGNSADAKPAGPG